MDNSQTKLIEKALEWREVNPKRRSVHVDWACTSHFGPPFEVTVYDYNIMEGWRVGAEPIPDLKQLKCARLARELEGINNEPADSVDTE